MGVLKLYGVYSKETLIYRALFGIILSTMPISHANSNDIEGIKWRGELLCGERYLHSSVWKSDPDPYYEKFQAASSYLCSTFSNLILGETSYRKISISSKLIFTALSTGEIDLYFTYEQHKILTELNFEEFIYRVPYEGCLYGVCDRKIEVWVYTRSGSKSLPLDTEGLVRALNGSFW